MEVQVIELAEGSRIQPSAKFVWKAASVPPWMTTRPSSSKVTAKAARGEGRFDPSTEARVHAKLDFVVSRIQIVLKGTS
jgi:hypothetical protein